jgi:tetratricopeptide (TPR) repeat protein
MKNKQFALPKNEAELVFSQYAKGEFHTAIKAIKSLNEQYPNQPFLFNLIGACYKEIGELPSAAKMFGIAISYSPKYSEAHFNLGATLQSLGEKESALKCYKDAVAINPNYPDAHNNLGNLYLSLGFLKEAIESLQWAVAYKHDFSEAYNNLGNAFNNLGQEGLAIDNYQKAILHNPNYTKAYFNIALIYKDLGNKEDFLINIKKALSLKPDWGHAHYHLSRFKTYKKDDPQIEQMKSFLKSKDIISTDFIGFNFALAKAYEDLEDYDKQFKYLDKANSFRKKELNYNITKDKRLFAQIKFFFDGAFPTIKESKSNTLSFRPIFILGLPRSGTSLVHQIIDCHKKVKGLGELNNLNKIISPLINRQKDGGDNKISNQDLTSIRQAYISSIDQLGFNHEVIADKMPLNFRFIGFILSAFPEAKIVHMNRDAMATCWSIYKYEFRGNAYSFNQKDIVQYYNLYKDLMLYWKKIFPNKIYDLSYESLTLNQELETRKLLDYCDLEWDQNCLNFHTNKSAVKTTSSMQVRQKMYQGSSEAWKKYEKYLQPLINGLNAI